MKEKRSTTGRRLRPTREEEKERQSGGAKSVNFLTFYEPSEFHNLEPVRVVLCTGKVSAGPVLLSRSVLPGFSPLYSDLRRRCSWRKRMDLETTGEDCSKTDATSARRNVRRHYRLSRMILVRLLSSLKRTTVEKESKSNFYKRFRSPKDSNT